MCLDEGGMYIICACVCVYVRAGASEYQRPRRDALKR